MIYRCAVCNRKLKDNESIDRGVGPVCERKLDREALIEIKESISNGYQPFVVDQGVIQLTIPEASNENELQTSS
ncbi:DUF6011 domain-containing protein [Piscibacillus sp. B03]|uniref:DUF6011 domain-containing protein n=1 Tax=Piscibacillus sp. B03 TaxID=3457430 RepID=UPI003FCDF9B0